jgi:hypothetical protein
MNWREIGGMLVGWLIAAVVVYCVIVAGRW